MCECVWTPLCKYVNSASEYQQRAGHPSFSVHGGVGEERLNNLNIYKHVEVHSAYEVIRFIVMFSFFLDQF